MQGHRLVRDPLGDLAQHVVGVVQHPAAAQRQDASDGVGAHVVRQPLLVAAGRALHPDDERVGQDLPGRGAARGALGGRAQGRVDPVDARLRDLPAAEAMVTAVRLPSGARLTRTAPAESVSTSRLSRFVPSTLTSSERLRPEAGTCRRRA
ncbi:hypothetical protein GCM10018779_29180 [Streptomyces griseocarneus]|nr:hypothetical protein GCM10018779_29180 [Streptomyces griseocarneus]